MATLRTCVLRKLSNLSSLRSLTTQSARQTLLSSLTENNPLRVIVCHGTHSSILNRILIRWSGTQSDAGSNTSPYANDGSGRRKRPPADLSVLFPGRDKEHWLIVMKPPPEGRKVDKQLMIDRYIKTLATVVGSEEAAIKAMYNVYFDRCFGFGCQISEEMSEKLKGNPGVWYVWQDSYVDVTNKDYGGELFVDGKIVKRSPEREQLVNGDGTSTRRSRDRGRSAGVIDMVLDENNIMDD